MSICFFRFTKDLKNSMSLKTLKEVLSGSSLPCLWYIAYAAVAKAGGRKAYIQNSHINVYYLFCNLVSITDLFGVCMGFAELIL